MKSVNLSALPFIAVFFSPALVAGDEPRDPPANPKPGGTMEKKHGHAPVNGLKLYYEVHGTGGTPLLLLHGGGSTIETTFGKILPALAKGRQVIAFDQQGHGRTADVADRPFTFEQSADDAAALLKHLGVERADLFGFSNGGHIAMRVAIRHPKLVRKLVVASAGFRRDGHPPEFWEFMKEAKLESMPKELRDAYVKLSPHPDRLQSFFDKSARRMREFEDFPPEDIRSIRAHTLVMVGDADNVRPEHAAEMFRLLPRAQLTVLPGGHGTAIGEVTAARFEGSQVKFGVGDPKKASKLPELVAAMIDEFLDTPAPEPGAGKAPAAPQKPEDWPSQFTKHLNAGDLDAVVELYAADARFVSPDGGTIVGRDKIRDVLAGLIKGKTRLEGRVIRAVTVGDTAILYTDFEGTTVDASGKASDMRSKAIEVLRRQPDGTWRLIVGDPNGRK
jgi:uncharacterized protein (TIGR02246 family)